jgi:hypothetical protein
MRGRLLLSLIIVAVLAAGLPEARGAPATKGGFIVSCDYSHTATSDPIVFPGQPGASHSHDFFGNESTNAYSTYTSMVAASTTCAASADTAGYWVPTPAVDGVEVHPSGRLGDMRIYYRAAGASSMETIPAGLAMIAGDKASIAPPPMHVLRWYCGAGDAGSTPARSHPYDCTQYNATYPFVDGVVGIVNFPRCWNGTGLSPLDVSYPEGGTPPRCPDAFPHLLPLVSERVHFGVMDPCAGLKPCGPDDPDTNVRLTVSSGPYYTLHADFWNTWQQATLDALVADCLNAHVACGFQRSSYTMSVAPGGTGLGTVTSEPAGIDCGSICAAPFDTAAHVTLHASPAEGSEFTGWGGDCSGDGSCVVSMERAHSVSATFDATVDSFTLSVTRDGDGGGNVSSVPVGIDCGATCSSSFPAGAEVTLTASPDGSSAFAGWTGACRGTGECGVRMGADTAVQATFTPLVRKLDARIRTGRAPFAGANVYGSRGWNQGIVRRATPGSQVAFVILLVNHGNAPDRFRIRGPGDRGPFRVRYLAGWDGSDGIGDRVRSGRYVTNTVYPLGERSIRLVVSIPRKARFGSTATWLVIARSTGLPSASDAVAARVVVARRARR